MQDKISRVIKKFADGSKLATLEQELKANELSLSVFKGANLQSYRKDINYLLDRRCIKLNENGYAAHLLSSTDDVSVYDFFKALMKDEQYFISPFMKKIQTVKDKEQLESQFILSLAGLAIAGILTNIYTAQLHHCLNLLKRQWAYFKHTVSGLVKVGYVGMGFNLAINLYFIFSVLFDPTKNYKKKLVDTLFLLPSLILNQTAYALIIAGGGVISTAAAWLFFADAMADFAINAYKAVKTFYELDKIKVPDENSPIDERINYIQKSLNYQRRASVSLISLCFAVITIPAIALWVFTPPTLGITIAVVAALAVFAISKHFIVKNVKEQWDDKIQTEIKQALEEKDQQELQTQYENPVDHIGNLEDTIKQPKQISQKDTKDKFSLFKSGEKARNLEEEQGIELMPITKITSPKSK